MRVTKTSSFTKQDTGTLTLGLGRQGATARPRILMR